MVAEDSGLARDKFKLFMVSHLVSHCSQDITP